jgi:chromate reductase
MNLIAFAASNSTTSINKQLVTYAVSLLRDRANAQVLDLNDFAMPLYSVDHEQAHGIPEAAQRLFALIGAADALLISFAEHNGSYTAAYKNIFDWVSRIQPKVFQGKPMVLLSASPGKGGAASVLKQAKESAPYFDADVKATLSVPSFGDHFDSDAGRLTDPDLNAKLQEALATLISSE